MTDPAFAHIGGAVVTDHGRMSLAAAREASAMYAKEAGHCRALGRMSAARACARRAGALAKAAVAAALWRRAAGWADPDAADGL